MKKVLTTLLLLVFTAGISPAAGATATEREVRAEAASVTGGSAPSFMLQRGRRWRRRVWRIRTNRGRTDNTWNRGRRNRRRWDDRRWNRGRRDNNWNRGRRSRGGGHGRH